MHLYLIECFAGSESEKKAAKSWKLELERRWELKLLAVQEMRFFTGENGILDLNSDGMLSIAGASHIREIVHCTGRLS